MDDLVFSAQFKRSAEIDAEPDRVAARHQVRLFIVDQRREQLHPDQDVPAKVILVFDDFVVLVADDIALPLQFGHERDLADHFFGDAAKIFRNALLVHSVRASALDFTFILRDRDDFDGGKVCLTKIRALRFKDPAEASFAKQLRQLPVAHDGITAAVIITHSEILPPFFVWESHSRDILTV